VSSDELRAIFQENRNPESVKNSQQNKLLALRRLSKEKSLRTRLLKAKAEVMLKCEQTKIDELRMKKIINEPIKRVA
jgi:hypothetical protein